MLINDPLTEYWNFYQVNVTVATVAEGEYAIDIKTRISENGSSPPIYGIVKSIV